MNANKAGPLPIYRAKIAFGNYKKGALLQPMGMYRSILLARGLIELAAPQLPDTVPASGPLPDAVTRALDLPSTERRGPVPDTVPASAPQPDAITREVNLPSTARRGPGRPRKVNVPEFVELAEHARTANVESEE